MGVVLELKTLFPQEARGFHSFSEATNKSFNRIRVLENRKNTGLKQIRILFEDKFLSRVYT